MNSFTFLLLCVQACLIQAVYSQCGCGNYATANAARVSGWPGSAAYAPAAAAYSGNGAGNVAVAGDLGVFGSTLISGQVPVLGAVQFNGDVPASGAVTISGSCGCGCEY